MLSIFPDKFVSASRPLHWDAPEYYKMPRGPRGNDDVERETIERHRRAMRGVGMW